MNPNKSRHALRFALQRVYKAYGLLTFFKNWGEGECIFICSWHKYSNIIMKSATISAPDYSSAGTPEFLWSESRG